MLNVEDIDQLIKLLDTQRKTPKRKKIRVKLDAMKMSILREALNKLPTLDLGH